MISIFKPKKRENKKVEARNWSDVTLKQYYEIRDVIVVQDDYTTFNLIDIIYGIDSQSLLMNELMPYVHTLGFLKEEPKVKRLKREYMLNGRKYEARCELGSVTAGQFVDWRNYLNHGDASDKMQNILSVFFIPKGHEYGDGYDVAQVQEDLLSLDYQTVYSAAFFFERQLRLLSRVFLHSLKNKVKKLKMEKEKKKEVIEEIKGLDLPSMISSLISLSTANLQTKSLQTH